MLRGGPPRGGAAPAPTDLKKQVTEAVVECDDRLLEKYFGEGAITKDELFHAFPKAIREGHIVPVLHTSAKKELGVRQFLDFLAHETPSPAEGVVRPAKAADGSAATLAPNGPFAAQVWKILVDPHVGKVAYLRVWCGLARLEVVLRRRAHGQDASASATCSRSRARR